VEGTIPISSISSSMVYEGRWGRFLISFSIKLSYLNKEKEKKNTF
jgi:hypothetical protein